LFFFFVDNSPLVLIGKAQHVKYLIKVGVNDEIKVQIQDLWCSQGVAQSAGDHASWSGGH